MTPTPSCSVVPPLQGQTVARIAEAEGLIEIPFCTVETYHGHGALTMLALTYQGLCGAMAQLGADSRPIMRSELSVLSGHPGPGVRDAFECVTRAVTRKAYQVDQALPWARYNQGGTQSYSFILSRQGRAVRAVLREGVLPPRFFDLLASQRAQDAQEFQQLRRTLAGEALAQAPQALYDYTPVAA